MTYNRLSMLKLALLTTAISGSRKAEEPRTYKIKCREHDPSPKFYSVTYNPNEKTYGKKYRRSMRQK